MDDDSDRAFRVMQWDRLTRFGRLQKNGSAKRRTCGPVADALIEQSEAGLMWRAAMESAAEL